MRSCAHFRDVVGEHAQASGDRDEHVLPGRDSDVRAGAGGRTRRRVGSAARGCHAREYHLGIPDTLAVGSFVCGVDADRAGQRGVQQPVERASWKDPGGDLHAQHYRHRGRREPDRSATDTGNELRNEPGRSPRQSGPRDCVTGMQSSRRHIEEMCLASFAANEESDVVKFVAAAQVALLVELIVENVLPSG